MIVRGDDLNPATDLHHAEAFRRRFPNWGRYGLSAYYVRNEEELDDLSADQLERFPMLEIFDRAALESARFEVIPTFRTPHVTIAFTGHVRGRINELSNSESSSAPTRIMLSSRAKRAGTGKDELQDRPRPRR
jgi:hypothetical protein